MTRLSLLLLVLAGLFCSPAKAHTTSQSFSSWRSDGTDVNAVFAVDARRITQLAQLYDLEGGLYPMLEDHLKETITVQQGNTPCVRSGIAPLTSDGAIIRARLSFSCPTAVASENSVVTIAAFHTVSATHIHIARIDDAAADGAGREVLLSEAQPAFSLSGTHTPGSLTGFVRLGFDHVLSGPDHLAFLAALLLLAGTLRRALIAVTGFTVGHSITLALAVLGIIEPREQMIEALIAFTIASTALEAGLPEQRKTAFRFFAALTALIILPSGLVLPFGVAIMLYVAATAQLPQTTAIRLVPVVAIAFGLIHGAGFAGGLTELELTGRNLVAPLLGFNIGVELGQILALGLILGIASLLGTVLPGSKHISRAWLALPLFCAGCFWFAERLWT
ncbi:HupE/UreJ family protein [Parvularcula sp. IMCC14364]|uniref:HupE/UreJ family protein n=1 Tax=Parvularcula sp. IMCC14364 TaxID=3067902 RepID=UPI0027411B16|nr:HupE/UreJ family protein [Parvularcula sp. IMCC14364]